MFRLSDEPFVKHKEQMALSIKKHATERRVDAWGKWIEDPDIALYQIDKLVS